MRCILLSLSLHVPHLDAELAKLVAKGAILAHAHRLHAGVRFVDDDGVADGDGGAPVDGGGRLGRRGGWCGVSVSVRRGLWLGPEPAGGGWSVTRAGEREEHRGARGVAAGREQQRSEVESVSSPSLLCSHLALLRRTRARARDRAFELTTHRRTHTDTLHAPPCLASGERVRETGREHVCMPRARAAAAPARS